MKPSLSVTIITKNGESTIRKSLESIKELASEIIVLDSGSTDNTIEICKEYTDKVYETDWPGFGIQYGRALAKASCDWVLALDHDEWLSDELKEEIKDTLENPKGNLYGFPRRTMYCGKWIRFGDAGKDIAIRLFKRGTATFCNDIIHERLITNEPMHQLKSLLYHNSYPNYDALMSRMNFYTSTSAQMRFEQGKKTSFTKAVISSAWAFFKAYFLRLGFLDGKIGFVFAVTCAESSFYRHLKLLELFEKQDI